MPVQVDEGLLLRLADANGVTPVIARALCGMPGVSEPLRRRCETAFLAALGRRERQRAARREIGEAASARHLPLLALKGEEIAALYADDALRDSSDIDLACPEERRADAGELLRSLGYTPGETDVNHDSYRRPPDLLIEMHHASMWQHPRLSSFFGDMWERAIPAADRGISVLPPADRYLYLLAHAAKHLCEGGFGLRTVLDLSLARAALPREDDAYVAEGERQMGLSLLAARLAALAQMWFDGEEGDAALDRFGSFLLCSGMYGTAEHRTAARRARGGSFFSRLFPSPAYMRRKYAVLGRRPWLLPLLYPYRLLRGLRRGGREAQALRTDRAVTDLVRDMLCYTGLTDDR